MSKQKEPAPENIIEFTEDHTKFEEEAKKLGENKLILLEFFATWSNPSRRLNSSLINIARDNTDVKFFKVDIDKNKEFSDHMGMKSNIPFIYFYKIKNNELVQVDKLQGFDLAKLKSKLETNKL